MTACVSLFVFFTIRRGTFQYIIEDDGSSTSQTPTTHDTNTCVKLTIVTDLSFSERIAIANLSYLLCGKITGRNVGYFSYHVLHSKSRLQGYAAGQPLSLYTFGMKALVLCWSHGLTFS